MMESESERPKPNADFLYELARHQLDIQLDFLDGLDNKLGLLFSLGSAEVAIAAAFLAVKPEMIRPQAGFLILGVIAYFVVAACSIAGLWRREWRVGSDVEHLGRLYLLGASDQTVKLQAAKRLIKQWNKNLPAFNRKARRLQIVLVGVAAETTVALLAVARLVL